MTEIALRRRDGAPAGCAVVDDADIARVVDYGWCLSAAGYVVARVKGGGGRIVLLHRLLLGLEPGDAREGDHRDGDKLNNRQSNLRIVTHAANGQNRPGQGGTSRFRGVGLLSSGRWRARAMVGGVDRHLGTFATEEDAAVAVEAWRREHMPYAEATRG